MFEARRDTWRGFYRHLRVRELMNGCGIEPASIDDIDMSEEEDLTDDFSEIAQVARNGYLEPGNSMEEEARVEAEGPETEKEALRSAGVSAERKLSSL